MAVIDHPVHPKVVLAAGTPYGCNNRRFAKGYWTHQRCYSPDGKYLMQQVFIEHTMSTECRYDKSLTDSRCATCTHKGKGEAYFNEVIALSS